MISPEYEKRLTEILPEEETPEAIRQSISALKVESESCEDRLNALLAKKEEMLLSRDIEKRLAINKDVESTRDFIICLQDVLGALEEKLKTEEQEKLIRELKAERAKLNYRSLAEDFAAAYARDYHRLATALVAILEKERLALAVIDQDRRLHERLLDLGVDTEGPLHTSIYAFGGPITSGRGLCELVRLPGVRGAPFVPIDHSVERKIRHVERDVFEDGHKIFDHHWRKTGTETIETFEDVHVYTPRREDTPIWPPEPLNWRRDRHR